MGPTGRVPPLSIGAARLTSARVRECAPLWGDRSIHTADELAELVERTQWLLSTKRARGAIFAEPNGRVRAFGISAFVHEDVAEAFLAAPYPQLGRRILLDPELPAIALDEQQVGRRNAGGGLHLVVLAQGFDLEGLDDGGWAQVAGATVAAFVDVHRGYNLALIINEIFGGPGVAFMERAKPATIHRFTLMSRSGERLVTACWFLSREEAERDGALILPMFSYCRPVLGLTDTERRILQVAVSGATDEKIARALQKPLGAIKSAWRRIQARAAADPHLGRQVGHPTREKGRGVQWRHLIVDYVRNHPEELTPFEEDLTDRSGQSARASILRSGRSGPK